MIKLVGTKTAQLRVLAYANVLVGSFIIAHLDAENRKAKVAVSNKVLDDVRTHLGDVCSKLDPAAGAPHQFIGDRWESCALCLTPLGHPIHAFGNRHPHVGEPMPDGR